MFRHLMRTAVLAAATFGALLATPLNAASLKEGMSWSEGFEAFRQDVFNAPNEVSGWFVEGERSSWRFPKDLGLMHGSAATTAADEQFVRALGAERVRTVTDGHTHPIAALRALRHPAFTSSSATALLPPSVNDIIYHIWFRERWFAPRGISYTSVVFDPSGVWTMRVKERSFARVLHRYLALGREEIPAAVARTELPAEKKRALLTTEVLARSDPQFAKELGAGAEVVQLYVEYRVVRDGLDNLYAPLLDKYSWVVSDAMHAFASGSQRSRSETIARVMEHARLLGVELSFEPYALYTE